MPKYLCDYCDIFLTHDSPSVRRAHNQGWRHVHNVEAYYADLDQGQAQDTIDAITRAHQRQNIQSVHGQFRFPSSNQPPHSLGQMHPPGMQSGFGPSNMFMQQPPRNFLSNAANHPPQYPQAQNAIHNNMLRGMPPAHGQPMLPFGRQVLPPLPPISGGGLLPPPPPLPPHMAHLMPMLPPFTGPSVKQNISLNGNTE